MTESVPVLRVQLFGRFRVLLNENPVRGLESFKVQELLAYLLLHRDRVHPRVTLASTLWAESTAVQASKYLRQALWHLHSAADGSSPERLDLVQMDAEYIGASLAASKGLDVAILEQAMQEMRGVPGHALSGSAA